MLRLGCSRSCSVDCAKGGLDRWSEVYYSCTSHERPARVSLLYTPAPHVSLYIKCYVTPAHSHTKDKTRIAVQVNNNRHTRRGDNAWHCISND